MDDNVDDGQNEIAHCGFMTEDEYKQLKAMIDRITEQEKSLKAHAQDAEDPFTPVMNGILDLLAVGKKRLMERLGGQRPPLNE